MDDIENASDILESFAENFRDESETVQQQILMSSVKLMIRKPDEGQKLVQQLVKFITAYSENPDLRDRAFIYWRLLRTSPEMAAKVVFSEKPPLSEQTYQIESSLLDKLIEHLGTLSSIYCKPPYVFVKRMRDLINAKAWENELDGEELLPTAGGAGSGDIDFFGDAVQ